jgi:Staphylococcal nuclease homologue
VTLELGAAPRDQEGAMRAFVFARGELVNAQLVRGGYAEVVTVPPDVRYRPALIALQVQAQAARVGLWADAEVRHCYRPARSGVVASRRTMSFFHVDDDEILFEDHREYFDSADEAARAGYRPSFNYGVLREREARTELAPLQEALERPSRSEVIVVVPVPTPTPPRGTYLWQGGVYRRIGP